MALMGFPPPSPLRLTNGPQDPFVSMHARQALGRCSTRRLRIRDPLV